MAELTREELIEKKAFSAPLELADNMDVLLKKTLQVVDAGKKLNTEFGNAKSLKEVSNTTKKLSTNQSELEKVEKRLTSAVEKNNREYIKKAAELKKVQRETRESIKQEEKLDDAYLEESRTLNRLRKKYKDLAITKGLSAKETKELGVEVNKLDKKLKAIDKSVGETGREVGNYKDKVKEALSETSVFGVNLGDIAGKFKGLLNPVTGVIAAIGALGAAYLSTARGARDLEGAQSRVTSAFRRFSNDVADVFDNVGASIDSMGNKLGILESIIRAFSSPIGRAIGDLDRFIDLKVQELAIDESRANEINKRLLNEAEIQRQIRDEERNSMTERMLANQELLNIIDEREKKQKDLFETQLQVMNASAMREVNDEERERLLLITDQTERAKELIDNQRLHLSVRQELQQIIAEIADIEEDSQGQRSEALANVMALDREANEDRLRMTTARIQEEILLAEEGSRREMELKIALVNEQEKVLLEGAGENEERRTSIVQESTNQRLQIYRDYQNKITQLERIGFTTFKDTEGKKTKTFLELKEEEMQAIAARYRKERDEAKKTAEETKRLEDEKIAKLQDNIYFGQELSNNFFQVQRNNINNELELLRNANEEKLQQEGLTEEGRLLIQKNFAEQEKRLRQEQARNDRSQAIFNILTNTAVGISSLLPGFPATLPLIIKAGLIGAAQIAAVPPVPQFAKGTKSSPEGYAIVNDGGGAELLERNGKYSMVQSDGAAMTYLKQGTRVHTAEETQELLAKGAVKNVAINDRKASSPLDGMIYSELKKISKGVNQVKNYNSYLDGKPITKNVNKRNAILNKVKSMNRY